MTTYEAIARPRARGVQRPGPVRVLIVAAHPDDETIGASSLIAPPSEAFVVHVTDGAPRDRRWWPPGITERENYARIRDREAERALAHVRAARIALGFVDQEAVHALPRIARLIADHIERLAPDRIVAHAYEGGHPDHDAVAAAVARARVLAGASLPVYEMALYHGAPGRFVAGEFIEGSGGAGAIHHALDREQLARRRAMLACFASQRATLAPFVDLAHERLRVAPDHDFARPPHDGPLLYERMGFAITGAEWRALARRIP